MEYAESSEVNHASVVGGGVRSFLSFLPLPLFSSLLSSHADSFSPTQLLGLEAAKAVYDLPTLPDIQLLIRQNYPLNRQLDAAAGELVLHKIEEMGVTVLTGCEPVAITTKEGENGERVFTGFELADGGKLASDLVRYLLLFSSTRALLIPLLRARSSTESASVLETNSPLLLGSRLLLVAVSRSTISS